MQDRVIMKNLALLFFRLFFAAIGFHHVKVKGKRASRMEAPILVGAPHSTFFDMLPVTVLGGPAVISKIENVSIPVLGSKFLSRTFL